MTGNVRARCIDMYQKLVFNVQHYNISTMDDCERSKKSELHLPVAKHLLVISHWLD